MMNRTRTTTFKALFFRYTSPTLFTALLAIVPFQFTHAQVAPSLGTAQSFAVLGATTVTNTGPTVVTGDLGVSPGTAVTGFPPGTVQGGVIHAADAVALQAQNDTTTAYNNLAGQACNFTYGVPTDIGGLTLVPGVYCFASSVQITGALTLDGGSNPNAVWIFKVGSTVTTASNSSVVLINGAQACNVFWQVGSSATIGTSTTFIGNILALTSITLTTNATMAGRALAQNGAVTMDSNTVSVTACAGAPIPPTIVKSFSPSSITTADVSTLTITLSNPNSSLATLSSTLTDNLPGSMLTSGSATTTCGGTASSTASSVSLSSGTIAANSSCTLKVNVTAGTAGNYNNSIAAGALQTDKGNNANPATATLTVSNPTPPTVSKAFSPSSIVTGGVSTLTITLNNPNPTVAKLTSSFIDTLPANLSIVGSGSTTCPLAFAKTSGPTINAATISLNGVAIPANGSCTVTVNVTSSIVGSYTNTIAAGALQTDKGSNASPASANLTVTTPVRPTVSKSFSPSTINTGGISTLTITFNNPNAAVAKFTSTFVDTLPANMLVVGGGSTTCPLALVRTKKDAVKNATISLSGVAIPANGSCTVTLNVTANIAGSYVNTIAAGALQTDKGSNASPASATLTVVNVPPSLSKTFSPTTISAGGTSTLTITLTNPNPTIANLTAALVDTLPVNLLITGSGSTTCPLSFVKTSNSKAKGGGHATITLEGVGIPANGSCTITVTVTTDIPGSYVNTIAAGALQTDKGNNANPATATLTVN